MTAATDIPTVGVPSVLGGGNVVVDLRSPAEYAEDHIPGAVNVPLFDDFERAVIGRLYRQHSPQAAFEAGVERVTARVASLVEGVAACTGWRQPPTKDLHGLVADMCEAGIDGLERAATARSVPLSTGAVVFHCWRGGLRSRSVVALLRTLGLDTAVALDGGYRAYRRRVVAELGAWSGGRSFVLRGWTGVGKTLVLAAVERLRPGWTVDLEGLADHRGSVLGGVGRAPRSQKQFDGALARVLRHKQPDIHVLEGESRKVGDCQLPDAVWRAVDGGTAIWVDAPLERRVALLMDEYLRDDASRRELAARLPFLEQRLGPVKWRGVLVEMLERGREAELVEVLLERYYDPRYRRSERGRRYAVRVAGHHPDHAAQTVVEAIEGSGVAAVGCVR